MCLDSETGNAQGQEILNCSSSWCNLSFYEVPLLFSQIVRTLYPQFCTFSHQASLFFSFLWGVVRSTKIWPCPPSAGKRAPWLNIPKNKISKKNKKNLKHPLSSRCALRLKSGRRPRRCSPLYFWTAAGPARWENTSTAGESCNDGRWYLLTTHTGDLGLREREPATRTHTHTNRTPGCW